MIPNANRPLSLQVKCPLLNTQTHTQSSDKAVEAREEGRRSMERGGDHAGGGEEFSGHRRHAKQREREAATALGGPAVSGVRGAVKIRLPANIRSRENPPAGQEPLPRQPLPQLREQDQYMPIANVIRIMRRILPAHAKISDDAKETIQECVSEYISFVTGEANERCQREQRKTVTADDVLWAMGKLGFDDYVEPLSLFLSRYRETEGDRASYRDPIMLKRSSPDCGSMVMLPPVPLQQQQQMVSYMQGPFPMQGDQQQQQQGMYDGGVLNGYYRNVFGPGSGSGSGSGNDEGGTSQNEMSNFDLYPQYK